MFSRQDNSIQFLNVIYTHCIVFTKISHFFGKTQSDNILKFRQMVSLWLANFFLECIEEKIFAHDKELLPKLFLRYIDDVYAVFDCDNDGLKFLELLNSQHKDVMFTVEKFPRCSDKVVGYWLRDLCLA